MIALSSDRRLEKKNESDHRREKNTTQCLSVCIRTTFIGGDMLCIIAIVSFKIVVDDVLIIV